MEKQPPEREDTTLPPPSPPLPPSDEAGARTVIGSMPAHDFAYYRQLSRQQEQASKEFVEIGPSRVVRQIWRGLVWLVLLTTVVGLFTVLFYHFTNSFRIALIIVSAMLVYMFAMAKLAEGRLDERNRSR